MPRASRSGDGVRRSDSDQIAEGLDFTLIDAQGQKQIVINNKGTDMLSLKVTNTSGETITLTPFSQVSSSAYHFKLSFDQEILEKTPLIKQAGSIFKWEAIVSGDLVYLGFKGLTQKITISPNKSISLELSYRDAVPSNRNNPKTKVTFWVGDNVSKNGQKLTGQDGTEELDLISSQGVPTAPPLSVDFVGINTVLNDKQTPNNLSFALTNMVNADLPIVPKSGEGVPTTFKIRFDGAPNGTNAGYEYALATFGKLHGISFNTSTPVGWNIPQQPDGHNQDLDPQWTITAKMSSLGLEPVVFQLTNIVSNLPSGVCRMYLEYQGLPGYPPGTLIAHIIKSSLLEGPASTDGFYLQSGASTQQQAPSFADGLTVRQFNSQANSGVFTGGKGLSTDNLNATGTMTAKTAVLGGARDVATLNVNGTANVTGAMGISTNKPPTKGLTIGNEIDGVTPISPDANFIVNGIASINVLQIRSGSLGGYPGITVTTKELDGILISSDNKRCISGSTGDSHALDISNNSSSKTTINATNNGCGGTDSKAFGFFSNARHGSSCGEGYYTHLPTREGPRVTTSLMGLEHELQFSGKGKINQGRGAVSFDEEIADLIAEDKYYRILLTPIGAALILAVDQQNTSGFTVIASERRNLSFFWLVIARKPHSLSNKKALEMLTELPDD